MGVASSITRRRSGVIGHSSAKHVGHRIVSRLTCQDRASGRAIANGPNEIGELSLGSTTPVQQVSLNSLIDIKSREPGSCRKCAFAFLRKATEAGRTAPGGHPRAVEIGTSRRRAVARKLYRGLRPIRVWVQVQRKARLLLTGAHRVVQHMERVAGFHGRNAIRRVWRNLSESLCFVEF